MADDTRLATVTPKMQAQIDHCLPVARSNNGTFSPRPQVQVSDEQPRSYRLYAVGGSTYVCPSVCVLVSVPRVAAGWGEYDIVWSRAIPRHILDDGTVVVLTQAAFDARVQAAVDAATAIAAQHQGWEAC